MVVGCEERSGAEDDEGRREPAHPIHEATAATLDVDKSLLSVVAEMAFRWMKPVELVYSVEFASSVETCRKCFNLHTIYEI